DQPAEFDWDRFGWAVRTSTRFLDNVIEATYYPYEENRTVQMDIRRTGLGFMGLGDLLMRMHIRYGSPEGIEMTQRLYRTLRDEAYRASVEIAKEKGTFPKFDREKYLQGWFIQRLPSDIQDGIREYGIRNAVILTQAPTGTTSLLAGVTSGIEPVYDFVFIRKDRIGEHEVYHPRYKAWLDAHPGETVPDYFVSAKQLTPEEHIHTQAAAQEFIDSSISKTVNAPEAHTKEDVNTLYTLAYELGCKGVAYFRENSRDVSVLYSKPAKDGTASGGKEAEQVTEAPKPMSVLEPRPRPEIMNGKTYKVATAYGTLFVTINEDADAQPFEVFATIGKSGGFFAEE
ncbi:MAG: ribonucleoside-diphosphate reductase, adenosylcobalamin-dependent, partial [bacterium]|nr:ribonucleoside-diphosphate reductase, adenosylcobalamin-dependent [bacterium]